MSLSVATFDTNHTDPLQDAQLDYYGKRLATASSDHTIHIWDVSTSQPVYLASLEGHNAPVWQISWSHPKFNGLLASCSFDKKVIIWKETQPNQWSSIFRGEDHQASVNSVSWAPWELGLHLATGSSDGTICIWSYQADHRWTKQSFLAHSSGVNSVSWAPPTSLQSFTDGDNSSTAFSSLVPNGSSRHSSGGQTASYQINANQPLSYQGSQQQSFNRMELVSGGSDRQVRVWRYFEDAKHSGWKQVAIMTKNPHKAWVRDVSWRPHVGLPYEMIASCSEDKTVILWSTEPPPSSFSSSVKSSIDSLDGNDSSGWYQWQILTFDFPVWKVAWSTTGAILAVASGSDTVELFKETIEGNWEKLTILTNNNNVNADASINQTLDDSNSLQSTADNASQINNANMSILSESTQQFQTGGFQSQLQTGRRNDQFGNLAPESPFPGSGYLPPSQSNKPPSMPFPQPPFNQQPTQNSSSQPSNFSPGPSSQQQPLPLTNPSGASPLPPQPSTPLQQMPYSTQFIPTPPPPFSGQQSPLVPPPFAPTEGAGSYGQNISSPSTPLTPPLSKPSAIPHNLIPPPNISQQQQLPPSSHGNFSLNASPNFNQNLQQNMMRSSPFPPTSNSPPMPPPPQIRQPQAPSFPPQQVPSQPLVPPPFPPQQFSPQPQAPSQFPPPQQQSPQFPPPQQQSSQFPPPQQQSSQFPPPQQQSSQFPPPQQQSSQFPPPPPLSFGSQQQGNMPPPGSQFPAPPSIMQNRDYQSPYPPNAYQ